MLRYFPTLPRLWLLTALWTVTCGCLAAQDEPPAEAVAEPSAAEAPATLAEQVEEEETADAMVPQAYPEDRYLTMWDKNPFMREVVPVIQKVENFSKDWTLAGISASGGVYSVNIFNKQTGAYQRIKEGQTGGEFRLDSVNFNKDRRQSSVKVTRGTETAELKYDDSLDSRPVTVSNTMAAPAGNPNQPGQGGAVNPNLPPGAQASLMQRGPNGQPLNPGAPGAAGLRPGMPGYVPGRPGSAPATAGNPAIDPATGAPLPGGSPGALVPGNFNPAANPAMGVPGAAPGGVPTPVSRRRQLIPAPIQQKQ